MNRLIIIGASGHGRVVADVASLVGYESIVFLEDDAELKECAGYPVLGPEKMLKELDGDVFVAIGDSKVRKQFMESESNRVFPVLMHPSAVIAKGVSINEGTVIMAGAVINPNVKIGKGCIVNTSSSVDHDCIVGDYSHVAVGSHLCGTVEVGESCWIGAGAVVSNNLRINSNATIGAGAVVIKDVPANCTVVGNPAKAISQ